MVLITQPLILHAICTNYATRMDVGESNFVAVSECWRSEEKEMKLSDCIPSFLLLVPAQPGVSAQFHCLGATGRVLKLEKSISVGQTGNPWQADGSSGFKGRPPVLSGPPCTFFSCKVPVKSADLAVLEAVPFIHELFQRQVMVGWKDSSCPVPLASRLFPSLLPLLEPQERQPQQRAGIKQCWICSKNQQQNRANQDCSFPGQLPARKPAQGSFFSTGFRRGHSELKKTSRSKTCLDHIPAPLLREWLLQRDMSDPMGSSPEEEPAELLSKGWHWPQLCLAPH